MSTSMRSDGPDDRVNRWDGTPRGGEEMVVTVRIGGLGGHSHDFFVVF
jgi:hypothetical protein